MTLTTLEMAAALCEQVYRRADQQQQLGSTNDLNGGFDLSDRTIVGKEAQNPIQVAGLSNKDGFFYDNSTGFVGQIVQDWTSGTINWLLDVMAPNAQLATTVVMNFQHLTNDTQLHLHPVVSRMLDPEVLKKLKSKSVRDDAD